MVYTFHGISTRPPQYDAPSHSQQIHALRFCAACALRFCWAIRTTKVPLLLHTCMGAAASTGWMWFLHWKVRWPTDPHCAEIA